jgi:thiamine-phosphate diphosphorylase
MKFSLPRLMLVTDRHLMQPDFDSALESALHGGARLVQLREKNLSDDRALALAKRVAGRCDDSGAQFLINNRVEVAREIGVGVHFPEREIENIASTRSNGVLIGASVHSLAAAQRAQKCGADYLFFGSVFETASHPESTPAGLEALREITARVSIPVFAIGGISVDNARLCLDAGAHGVAVIRAVWQAPDVARAVRELLVILEQ